MKNLLRALLLWPLLALGAVSSTPPFFYVLSPAEIAGASVVTNTAYIWGDLRRYGCTPGANCTTALANAAAQANQVNSAPIYIPQMLGCITITAGVTFTAPVLISGDTGFGSGCIQPTDITVFTFNLGASGSTVKSIQISGVGLGAVQPCTVWNNAHNMRFESMTVTKCGIGVQMQPGANSSYLGRIDNSAFISNNQLNIDAQKNTNALYLFNVTFGGSNPAQSVTAVTQAASGVVTFNTVSATNPFPVNQNIYFTGLGGMTQLNGLVGKVTANGGSSGAWTATFNINTSAFTAYTSGGTVEAASIGFRFIDSTNLGVFGFDCEGLRISCVEIDNQTVNNVGGYDFRNGDFESNTNCNGDVRLGATQKVFGFSISGVYSSTGASTANCTNNSMINAVNVDGLRVDGGFLNSGYFGSALVDGWLKLGAGATNLSISSFANVSGTQTQALSTLNGVVSFHQSAQQSLSTGSTITVGAFSVVPVTEAAAITGVIIQAGTHCGQQLIVLNNAAFSIQMATSGTSHVADGTSDTINASNGAHYTWDCVGNLWYHF